MAEARKKAARGGGPQQAAALKAVANNIGRAGDAEFDRLIYERIRLGIVSALSVSERLAFTELRQLLDTTDGNLSAHARKLEDAGYIECKKSFTGRVPHTEYGLTSLGRARLKDYLAHMEALIEMTRQA